MRHFPIWNYSLACVAGVSVWFRSKERPRNGIFGFPKRGFRISERWNESQKMKEVLTRLLAPFFARSLTLAPRSLLRNQTETLAAEAKFSYAFWPKTLYDTGRPLVVSGALTLFLLISIFRVCLLLIKFFWWILLFMTIRTSGGSLQNAEWSPNAKWLWSLVIGIELRPRPHEDDCKRKR